MGWIVRWLAVGCGLWLLWGWKGTEPFTELPLEKGAFVEEEAALAAVPEGRIFHLEGSVHSRETPAGSQEFIVFLFTEETKDHTGGRRVETRRYERPALEFRWAGGALMLERDGYQLRHAPRLPNMPWHRFSQLNSGFREGDRAVLTAMKKSAGFDGVMLSEGPREALEKRMRRDNRRRSLLGGFLKGAASLILVSVLWPRWKPRGEQATPPRRR